MKVAEIDEITVYGMLTAGGLVCKCINVFAYKSARAYLPTHHIRIADKQCAMWYIVLDLM